MSREYGEHRAEDGSLNYTSASQLTTADHNSYGGCLRSWWYKYIGGKETEETEAMRRGTTLLHTPIENYYATKGDRATLTPLVMQGERYLYPPGDDIIGEWEVSRPLGAPTKMIARDELGKKVIVPTPLDLSIAPMRAAGLPFVGRIDLMHARGWYWDLQDDGSVRRVDEAPGHIVLEINDWKSTGKREYAKTSADLRTTVQMNSYGAWGFKVLPSITHVRLTHTYFLTGKADPDEATAWRASTLMDREAIATRWEYIEGVSRRTQEAAHATKADDVPANTKSCGAYGRKGCPHKSYCSAANHHSLAKTFGTSGAARILGVAHAEGQAPGLITALLAGPNQGTALRTITPLAREAPQAAERESADVLPQAGRDSGATVPATPDLAGLVPVVALLAGRALRDLSAPVLGDQAQTQSEDHRSRSSDRAGSGNNLPGLQPSIGSFLGQPAHAEACSQLPGDTAMSLTKLLTITPPNTTPPTVTPVNTPEHVGVTATIGSIMAPPVAGMPTGAMAALLAEEAKAAVDQPLVDAFAFIVAANMGEPTYTGPMAKARNPACTGDALAGSGKLAGLPPHATRDQVLATASDLRAYIASQQPAPAVVQPVAPVPAPIAIVSPETPASRPELAADPVEGVVMPGKQSAAELIAAATVAAAAPVVSNVVVPAAITTSTLIASSAAPSPEDAAMAAATAPPAKRKRGRPTGTTKKAEGAAEEHDESEGFELYYDCIPSKSCDDLQPYVDQLCKAIVDFYKVDPPDLRCAGKDIVPLAYGAWRGSLAAGVREIAAQWPQRPMLLRRSDINEVVRDALISAKAADGTPLCTLVVQGIGR